MTVDQTLANEHISVSHIVLCENMLDSMSQPQLHGPPLALSAEVIILL